jgi:hypothetical protein
MIGFRTDIWSISHTPLQPSQVEFPCRIHHCAQAEREGKPRGTPWVFATRCGILGIFPPALWWMDESSCVSWRGSLVRVQIWCVSLNDRVGDRRGIYRSVFSAFAARKPLTRVTTGRVVIWAADRLLGSFGRVRKPRSCPVYPGEQPFLRYLGDSPLWYTGSMCERWESRQKEA